MADHQPNGDNPNLISMSDTTPTRADAVKNRAVLLRTARRLFNADGVDNTTMTQLADEAGVGKGTLYRHFSNKAEVCYALLDSEQRELQAGTFEQLRDSDDPAVVLRAFLADVVQFVWRNDELLSPALHEGNVSSLEFPAHVWYRQTIRGLLGRAGATGDLDYLADVLYVMLNVETIHYQRHTLGYDQTRVIDGILRVADRLIS
mgnify:CR=1 FL=1